MKRNSLEELKENLKILREEKEKISQSMKRDVEKMDEFGQRILNIEKEEKWLRDDMRVKEAKLKEIGLTIQESEDSYERLGGHVEQMNELLVREIWGLGDGRGML